MAGRSVDVSLRIKAQDEASKALDAVGKALKDLGGAQAALAGGSSGVKAFVESLSKNVDGLSAVFAKLDSTVGRANAAYDTQAKQLGAVSRSISDRKRRIEELAKAEEDLQRIQGSYKNVSPAKQATFVGPVPPKLTAVRSQLGTETNTLAKEEASLNSLISKMADLRTATDQTKGVQAQLAGALASTKTAFFEQAEALDRVTAAEKRAEQASRNRLQGAALAGRVNASTGVTGTRATDAGAGFSALAAREDAIALKDAATAHAAFEARVKSGADAMRREEASAAALGAEIDEMRRDFDRAGYANAFLERETKKLDRALKAGILTQKEYGKALESVKRKSEQLGEQSNPKLFGLNPYQTQNLMFQFNDVATQLASGTSITQTLAQQGGQILQLFPKVGNAIIGAFTGAGPYIAVVAAAITPLVLGLKSAADQAERIRSLGGLLAAIGTEGGSSVQQLSDAAKAIDRYGVSAEEAMSITRKLTREGFDATQIEQFGKTAKDMSDVLGIDLNQSVGLLTDAYGGNLESLRRLMDETDAFTPAQRQMIEALYSSGDAAGALDKAFGILSKNMGEGAKQARGPWAEAFRNLGNAWDELVTQLGNTWWAQAALDGINALAEGLDFLTGKSEEARRAEAERQGAYGGTNPRAADPLAASAANPNGLESQSAPGKVDKEPVATAEQVVNAAKMTKEMRQQAIEAKKVTSQKVIQEKLDVLAEQTRDKIGDSVSKQKQDEAVALALKLKRVELEEQLSAYTKRTADEAERESKATAKSKEDAIKKFTGRVVAAEGGTAKNPFSSAQGAGQFIDSTWIDQFKKVYKDAADGLTRSQILALRQDKDVAAGIIDNYARENAKFLEKIGAEVTAGNLYLAHFLGAGGAKKILQANTSTPVDKLLGKDVLDGNKGYLYTNGRARTAGELRTFIAGRVGDTANAGGTAVTSDAQVKGVEAIDQAGQKLEQYNISLDDKLSKEERSIANQRELVGLQGEALRAEIERQTVAEQIAQATDDLRRTTGVKDAVLDQSQIDRITVDVKARLKLDEPAKVAADLQKQVSDLEASRGLLESKLQEKQSRGDVGGMRDVQQQIDDIDARIAKAAQSYLDFLNTPGNADALGLYGVELDNMIAKFSQLSQKTAEWKLEVGSATISASEFANAFTSSAVSALDQFAQAIANGKNAFSSLWDAFRQFAADFLIQIAQMIQKQIIFNLVSGLLKSLAGGLGGAAAAPASSLSGGFSNFNLSSLQFHKGGLVGGGGGEFRSISAAAFNGAARYHSGGIAGLKPNEVPAVLMRGEEVLTRDDPRHMMNGGGGGAGGNVKIVNAFDVGDAVSKGMETRAGEKAILNLVRNNPRAFRAAMGNG